MASQDVSTLPNPPLDSVSSIECSPVDPDKVLACSWDCSVRLYSTKEHGSDCLHVFSSAHAALLDVCWSADGTKAWCGGLEGHLRQLDINTGAYPAVAQHTGSISSLIYHSEKKVVVAGDWDLKLTLHDERMQQDALTVNVPERVYAVSSPAAPFPHTPIHNRKNTNLIVAAMASRLFGIWDVRNMGKPVEERESSLKYLTRSLGCMLDGEGYATASVEGRIAVEYFDPDPAVQEKKYAFKCHRTTENDVDYVYPVNGLAFHPVYNTFASYGSDGTVSVWDHKVKKRLRQYVPKFDVGVTSGAFNCDGTKLLLATGQTWDNGDSKYTGAPPTIWVRRVGGEVKPKGA